MPRNLFIRLTVTAAAAAVLTPIGLLHALGATTTPAPQPASLAQPLAAAPYLMPFDNNPPDPVAVMKATGQRTFQLAFILASGTGGCSPTWDGTRAVAADTEAAALIARIRANGGDVSVSAGGFGGTKLGQTCASPEATAVAYQAVVSKYHVKAIDFDLEEPEYENATAIHNELGAAQILQRSNPGLFVSVTTAATTDGTGFFGKQLLQEAHSLGFMPHDFSIMPFDGGFSGADVQIDALDRFHTILMSTFGMDSAQAFAREGVSLMNGRSDSGEMFPQSAFQQVLAFAQSHHLARFTFWSVNRDRPCADPNQMTTSGVCSTVSQAPFEFTRFTVRFAGQRTAGRALPLATSGPASGGGTRVSPSPTATEPPATGSATASATTADPAATDPAATEPALSEGACAGAPQWSTTAVFTGEMLAVHNAILWKAKWWTQGEVPGRADVWVEVGPCPG